MFLCAYRFETSLEGVSLVDLVSELRRVFEPAGVQRGFEAMLLIMGYFDEHAALYGRTLRLEDTRLVRVEIDTPRLRRAIIPAAIRSARYVLDIDSMEVPFIGIPQMINEFELD
jgi:hypothetical protein